MTVIPCVSYFSSFRDCSRLKWPEMEGRGQTLAMTKKRKNDNVRHGRKTAIIYSGTGSWTRVSSALFNLKARYDSRYTIPDWNWNHIWWEKSENWSSYSFDRHQKRPLEPASSRMEDGTIRCIHELWNNLSNEHRARCQKLMVLKDRNTGAWEDIGAEMQPNEAPSCQTPSIWNCYAA